MKKLKGEKTMEVCRSVSRTIQLKQYEPLSIFCSAKDDCLKAKRSKTSDFLFEFCLGEVLKNIENFKADYKEKYDETTGLPIIQTAPQPKKTGYDPMRKWRCGCDPVKGIFCDKHGMEREDRRFEEYAEAEVFKEEIDQMNKERKESDAEALKEFEETK